MGKNRSHLHLGRRTALGLVGAGLAAPFIRPSLAQQAWPEQTSIPDILKGSGEVRIAGYGGSMQEAQGLLKRDAWGIPKGAKNKVNAMKFVAFSTMAIPQARVALAIPYGSVNTKSDEYIPAARQEVLPSAPAIKKQLVTYNYDWWIDNREAVIPKFNKWLLS